jgi:hypothetical protein
MGILLVLAIGFIGIVMYSMCVVSSRCSREEERIAESIKKARVEN